MRHVARALVSTAAFLELSGDDVLDPDSAVKAMEQIAHDLSALDTAEYSVLAGVCSELADEARSAGPAFRSHVEFCESFMENFGARVAGNA